MISVSIISSPMLCLNIWFVAYLLPKKKGSTLKQRKTPKGRSQPIPIQEQAATSKIVAEIAGDFFHRNIQAVGGSSDLESREQDAVTPVVHESDPDTIEWGQQVPVTGADVSRTYYESVTIDGVKYEVSLPALQSTIDGLLTGRVDQRCGRRQSG